MNLFLNCCNMYVAKLKCHLSDRGDPYYFLQPVFVEVAHLDPEILIFHDMVKDEKICLHADALLPLLADHVRVQFDGGGRCGRCDVQLGRGGRRHLMRLLHLVLLRSQNFTLHMESLSVSTYVWVCDLCSV